MSDNERDCEHGQLARVCQICELQAEITALRAECEGLRKDAALRRAIHRAARELPKGKVVSVCVENGAGWVYWSDEIGFVHQVEPNDLTLAGQVNFAIDTAIERGPQR